MGSNGSRLPTELPAPAEWLAAIEEHLFDAMAARERATGDRLFAEQAEAEAIRELRYWETLALEMLYEMGGQ